MNSSEWRSRRECAIEITPNIRLRPVSPMVAMMFGIAAARHRKTTRRGAHGRTTKSSFTWAIAHGSHQSSASTLTSNGQVNDHVATPQASAGTSRRRSRRNWPGATAAAVELGKAWNDWPLLEIPERVDRRPGNDRLQDL